MLALQEQESEHSVLAEAVDRFSPSPPRPGTVLLTRFGVGSARLSAQHRRIIARLAPQIVDRVLPTLNPRCERLILQIEGHEDETGDPARFRHIGIQRAMAVARTLVARMRRTRTYIRWVQTSLNRLIGARLAVDGISGSRTRNAVRTFQRRRGLKADGVVGPRTESALIAAGAPRLANWPPRLDVRSAGPTRPIRSNVTARGRSQNRRVELRAIRANRCRRA